MADPKLIDKKLEVLRKVARVLNENQILWSVGASTLLYLRGMVENFHDIDIMIDENAVDKVKTVLGQMGEVRTYEANNHYKTKAFMEFLIDGIDMDVIAGFVIVNNDVDYYLPLRKEDIVETIEMNGEMIPLHSVKEWRWYYDLMNRVDKVNIIDNFEK